MDSKKIRSKFGVAATLFFERIENALNFCEIATYRARLIKSDDGDLYVPFLLNDVLTDAEKTAALKNLDGLFIIQSWERDGEYFVSFQRPEKKERKLKNVKVKQARPAILTDMENLYEAFLIHHNQNKDAIFGDKWPQNRKALKHIYAVLKAETRKHLGENANINDVEDMVYASFNKLLKLYNKLPKELKGFELISLSNKINKIIEFFINLKNENSSVRSAEQRAADAREWELSKEPA